MPWQRRLPRSRGDAANARSADRRCRPHDQWARYSSIAVDCGALWPRPHPDGEPQSGVLTERFLADGGMRLTARGMRAAQAACGRERDPPSIWGSLAFGADGEMLAPNIDLTVAGDGGGGGSAGEIAATELSSRDRRGVRSGRCAARRGGGRARWRRPISASSVGGALTNSGEIRSDGAFHIAGRRAHQPRAPAHHRAAGESRGYRHARQSRPDPQWTDCSRSRRVR